MNVLIIPAYQMPPDTKGAKVDARGFLAEVIEATAEGSLELRTHDESHHTITMEWLAAGVYQWQGDCYSVWTHFNPARGDIK